MRKPKLNSLGFPLDLNTRMFIVFFLDVIDSNPNGDPLDGGRPRQDPLTERGHISPAALKRKLRDYLLMTIAGEQHYFMPGSNLTETRKGADPDQLVRTLRDLRYFGGSLVGLDKSVRGPIVFRDAVSVDPIDIADDQGVGSWVQLRKRTGKDGEEEEFEGGNMPMRATVPYGLYRGTIAFDPIGAKQVGMTEEDLDLFWEALFDCWEYTRSATRPNVNLRRVFAFTFSTRRGNVPSHVVDSWIKVAPVGAPTCFDDYTVEVNLDDMPEDMSLHSWVDGIVDALSLAAK